MPELSVRRAQRGDAEALVELIVALADFEKLAAPAPEARARLIAHGWPDDGSPARFEAWLCERQGDNRMAIAYAITMETYSTFLCKPTLYLEDLFVLPDHRRCGAGRLLMETLLTEARARGCGRMEWVVLDWNTGAQEFYRQFGAKYLSDWQQYRVTLTDSSE